MLTVLFYLTIHISASYKWLQISGDDAQQMMIRKNIQCVFKALIKDDL